ncbi:integral membrane protein GPR137C isoform X2 [Synchiropus splendidus]|uniref:integral membrane protein GPR137C isoform X2 n=1 Tax=Synchiropus splendidus TaxID=270530 RepID=UPI00237EA11C|nr:integral membrane protein GPR137C isoform X2 [Synchiropus splendidus]
MYSAAEVRSRWFTSAEETPGAAAASSTLELSLTSVYTLLYSFLFVFVYLQLWLILHYGHKRFSFQSVFLFLCLVWAALRATLFSFYFKNVVQANQLQPLVYWLLYCCPVCLQFFTLCLLNLYFTQVMFKAKAKYSPELTKYRVPLRLFFLFLSVCFLVVNLTCALLIQGALERAESPSGGDVRHAVLARVLINDSLFVLCAVSLAVCIYKVAKMSSANVYLESKGTSVCQATAIGAVVILLYTSRACYNLVVVTLSPQDQPSPFNYGWYSVSDQLLTERRLLCWHLDISHRLSLVDLPPCRSLFWDLSESDCTLFIFVRKTSCFPTAENIFSGLLLAEINNFFFLTVFIYNVLLLSFIHSFLENMRARVHCC